MKSNVLLGDGKKERHYLCYRRKKGKVRVITSSKKEGVRTGKDAVTQQEATQQEDGCEIIKKRHDYENFDEKDEEDRHGQRKREFLCPYTIIQHLSPETSPVLVDHIYQTRVFQAFECSGSVSDHNSYVKTDL